MGRDWREYESEEGCTHLEELLIYQPEDWRKQAREYLFGFDCNLARESKNEDLRTIWSTIHGDEFQIFMKISILVVLFHPAMKRACHYGPLNFLLAYGIRDPLPALLKDIPAERQQGLLMVHSPLTYFLEFSKLCEQLPHRFASEDRQRSLSSSFVSN